MPRKTIHGIDPYAPGGIEALMAHHRLTFGNAVMEAEGGEGAGDGSGEAHGGEQEQAGAGQQEAGKGAGAQQEASGDKAAEWDGKIESLPADAQKVIADLRKQAGDERVAAKTLAAIQKAINPDAKGDEKPTAEQLTKALTERDADAKQAKTELAVFRLAGKQGADADALLDSRSFLAKLKDIDHSDSKAITKAITDAVTENPKLKAVLAAGKSGADFAGGSGDQRNKKSMSLAEATAAHYQTT